MISLMIEEKNLLILMRIINGRCTGDLFGDYTCFNSHGQSTVDYLISSEKLFSQILYFNVSEFISTLSDCHCKISWEIIAKFQEPNMCNTNPDNTFPAPQNFIWNFENACV